MFSFIFLLSSSVTLYADLVLPQHLYWLFTQLGAIDYWTSLKFFFNCLNLFEKVHYYLGISKILSKIHFEEASVCNDDLIPVVLCFHSRYIFYSGKISPSTGWFCSQVRVCSLSYAIHLNTFASIMMFIFYHVLQKL